MYGQIRAICGLEVFIYGFQSKQSSKYLFKYPDAVIEAIRKVLRTPEYPGSEMRGHFVSLLLWVGDISNWCGNCNIYCQHF